MDARSRALAALCATEIVSWGVLYYAFPVLAPSISADTGWPVAAVTAAFSAGLVVSGLVGIASGRLLDRIGPRPVMTAGSILLLQSDAKLPVELAMERQQRAARIKKASFDLKTLPQVRIPYRMWRAPALDFVVSGGATYRAHGLGYVLRRTDSGHTWQADLDELRSRAVETWPGFHPGRLMEL